MILVDANILLYAYHPRAKKHEACRSWVEEAFSGPAPVYIAWITILAFLRISTDLRIFDRPLSMPEAIGAVTGWLSMPAVSILDPTDHYWEKFAQLLETAQVTGPLVTDAALAALALEHGIAVCTMDRDFTRFHGLKLDDPTERE
jgi:toxin-antitoxin system PIN domain toxin